MALRKIASSVIISFTLGGALPARSQAYQNLPLFFISPAPAELVYSYSRDRCDLQDTPDAPPRVFRDANGVIRMFASHDVSRSLVGKSFDHLTHYCAIIFDGLHSSNPADYNDRQWITSVWTSNGRIVAALMHNEFQGNLRPWLCPSQLYLACWENSITLAVSYDGGRSFRESNAPQNVVATLPYPYQGDIGHPIGYFQPTNIVQTANGTFYVMIHAESFRQQRKGECVLSTKDPFSSSGWQAWNGHTYSVSLSSTHVSGTRNEQETCEPVGLGSLFNFGSLTFDSITKTFVAVTSIQNGGGNAQMPPGVYVSLSKDLIGWSTPALLISEEALRSKDEIKTDGYGFYSLIDENSESRNFDTISRRPRLFLYFDRMDQAHAPFVRDLVRLPVRMERTRPN